MKVSGNLSILADYNYEAQLYTDSHVGFDQIWIQGPVLTFNERTQEYEELIRVYTSYKDQAIGEKMVEEHNRIYHSPLMKALREV